MNVKNKNGFIDRKMIKRAIKDSFIKLSFKTQKENPVMFLVYLSSILTTLLWIASLCGYSDASPVFIFGITVILWFTVLFANFAEYDVPRHLF